MPPKKVKRSPEEEEENEKPTQPHKRGRKTTTTKSSSSSCNDHDDKSAVVPLPLTVFDEKDDKSAVIRLPLPTPKPRVNYTFINSNVIVNQLTIPKTASSGATGTPAAQKASGALGFGSPVEEKKPPAELSTVKINLKVKDQYQNEVSFRITRSTPLRKVINEYYEQQNKERGSQVFLFDGRFFRGDQTPDDLGMEDDDEIDAMISQTGGGYLP